MFTLVADKLEERKMLFLKKRDSDMECKNCVPQPRLLEIQQSQRTTTISDISSSSDATENSRSRQLSATTTRSISIWNTSG